MDRLDAVVDVVRRQVADQTTGAAQLYVSLWGEPLLDVGIGTTPAGRPVRPEHLLPWYGMSRLMTTVAVLQQVERGALGLDDPVSAHLSGWAGGKQACTIRHLLTHLGGFPTADTTERRAPHEVHLNELIGRPADHVPGTRAVYHRSASWRVLGAVVSALDGRPLGRYLREQVWDPTGMNATYLGLSRSDVERLREWIVPVDKRGSIRRGWTGAAGVPAPQPSRHREVAHLLHPDPDAGAWGPAHDLGAMLEDLIRPRGDLLRERATRELLSVPQRHSLRDGAFGGERVPWGLGMMVGGSFGGTTGWRAFGHDGLPGGRALADPVEGIVTVFLVNGITSPVDDAERAAEVTDAVYDALAPKPRGPWITADPGTRVLRG